MPQLELAADEALLRSRTERVVLLILAAVQFTSVVDFMVVMPLGTQLMRKLHINPTQFGLIVASYTFAAGAAGLVASSIVDRYSRRAAFLTLFAGFLVGTLLCGLAPNYPALLAARVATGAFGGILGGMSLAIIGDVFPEERRGQATGWLTTGFALATVAGVPAGLSLGTTYGWHVPFICLSMFGLPILLMAAIYLPPLNAHLGRAHVHPLRSLVEIFSVQNHLNAFALIAAVMIGAFAVNPYVSDYLVANVGLAETDLRVVYFCCGCVTLFFAPLVGKLADRYGKLTIYRAIVPISAAMLVTVTNLPVVGSAIAIAALASLMVSNVGRMIPAMAMITSSVDRGRRGSFMSANAAVQHFAVGTGACFGGLIIKKLPDLRLQNFGLVGWIAATITLASLWVAGRVRIVDEGSAITKTESLAAAAEATCDVGEPIIESS